MTTESNRDTARELLGGLRPDEHASVRAAGDAELIAALDLLEHDAELRAWYDEECALDAVLARKFADATAAAVPPGLDARLRQALAEHRQGGGAAPSSAIPFRGGWWLAAAAAVALLLVVGSRTLSDRSGDERSGNGNGTIVQAGSPTFVDFRDEMTHYALESIELGHRASDWQELNKWLASKTPIECGDLPKSIASLETMGCNVVDWGTTHVSLYCFQKDGTGEVVHLFVIEKSSLGGVPPCEVLHKPLTAHGLETAAWQDDKKLYLLVGSKPGVHVSELL